MNTTPSNDESHTLSALKQVGALVSGHFGLASGMHSETYINKDAVYMHPQQTSEFCEAIAHNFREHGVEVVIGPATGGVILAQWVAHHLTQMTDRKVLAMYADKADDSFVLKRGYSQLVEAKRVLVVEDILTTGSATRRVCEIVENNGGSVVGIGALVNRSPQKPILAEYDLKVLLNYHIVAYSRQMCPLCKQGIPTDSVYGRGS